MNRCHDCREACGWTVRCESCRLVYNEKQRLRARRKRGSEYSFSVRKCSVCKVDGHDVRTCEQRRVTA